MKRTVIASYKGIAVVPPQLAVDILLGLLESNVHVAIDGLKLACLWHQSGGIETAAADIPL